MDLKIYFMYAGTLMLTLSIGFIIGAVCACKVIRFGLKTWSEAKEGDFNTNKKSSKLVDALNEQEGERMKFRARIIAESGRKSNGFV